MTGILYVLTTGCSWEHLPHDIGATWQSCHRYLLDYQRRRVWQKIVRELSKLAYRKGKINLHNAYHDASVVKSKKGAKTK
jgi:transposase